MTAKRMSEADLSAARDLGAPLEHPDSQQLTPALALQYRHAIRALLREVDALKDELTQGSKSCS